MVKIKENKVGASNAGFQHAVNILCFNVREKVRFNSFYIFSNVYCASNIVISLFESGTLKFCNWQRCVFVKCTSS